jgi:phosphoenolpyruvate synthase/pyruvate phosphate dikinase
MATRAVFNSWFGKRAIDYRNATNISHDLGTAVNIVTMVFGNMGDTAPPALPSPATRSTATPNSTATSDQRAGRRCGRGHPQHAAHRAA